jgi:hypothetical protein
MSGERIRVDMAELTLRELAAVGRMLAPRALSDVMQGPEQTEAIAALVCVIKQRTDPTFTFEQALDLHMGDVEFIAPESNGDGAGMTQLPSPASGDSIRSAS